MTHPDNILLMRLLSYYDTTGGQRACWCWRRSTNGGGYGRLTWRGHTVLAHREMYRLLVGDIPAGLDVLHECDNPLCGNPRHLLLGTHAHNMQDRARKRRGNHPMGDRHGSAKLTDADVLTIRAGLRAGVPQKVLAAQHGVSTHAIWRIANGKGWTHLP